MELMIRRYFLATNMSPLIAALPPRLPKNGFQVPKQQLASVEASPTNELAAGFRTNWLFLTMGYRPWEMDSQLPLTIGYQPWTMDRVNTHTYPSTCFLKIYANLLRGHCCPAHKTSCPLTRQAGIPGR